MKGINYFVSLIIIFAGLTCKQYDQTITDPSENNHIGKISLSVYQAPDDITDVIATISRRHYEKRILKLSISDSGNFATGIFNDIPIGIWRLKVDAVDNLNYVRYSGEKDIEVLPSQTAYVELELLKTSGSIEIVVTWGKKCVALPRGAIAWWRGEGNANDVLGKNHGTLHNGTSFENGYVGKAIKFDGVDDKINVKDCDDFSITGSFTIEGWIFIESFPNGKQGQILFRGDDRMGYDPYYICTKSGEKIKFHVESLTSSVSLETKVPISKFIHLATLLDTGQNKMQIYINGDMIAETTTTIVPFDELDNNYDPFIGIGNHGGFYQAHNQPFHGLVDELTIYDRALTPSEIRSIFLAGRAGKCIK